jgi:hypothetical protein
MLAPPFAWGAALHPHLSAASSFVGSGFVGIVLFHLILCALVITADRAYSRPFSLADCSVAFIAIVVWLVLSAAWSTNLRWKNQDRLVGVWYGLTHRAASEPIIPALQGATDPRNAPLSITAISAFGQGAKVVVAPEGYIRRWSPATEALWADIAASWPPGLTLIIGANTQDGDRSRSVSVVVQSGGVVSKVDPVMEIPFIDRPLSQLPWMTLGPHARSTTLELAGERVALYVCYEEFMAWRFLSDQLQERAPSAMVVMSNHSWTTFAPLPQLQARHSDAWAAWFGLPLIRARSLPN